MITARTSAPPAHKPCTQAVLQQHRHSAMSGSLTYTCNARQHPSSQDCPLNCLNNWESASFCRRMSCAIGDLAPVQGRVRACCAASAAARP